MFHELICNQVNIVGVPVAVSIPGRLSRREIDPLLVFQVRFMFCPRTHVEILDASFEHHCTGVSRAFPTVDGFNWSCNARVAELTFVSFAFSNKTGLLFESSTLPARICWTSFAIDPNGCNSSSWSTRLSGLADVSNAAPFFLCVLRFGSIGQFAEDPSRRLVGSTDAPAQLQWRRASDVVSNCRWQQTHVRHAWKGRGAESWTNTTSSAEDMPW